MGSIRAQISAQVVHMAMQVETRPGPANEPVDRFEPAVGRGIIIMDAERRRVSDEDIQCRSIAQSRKKKPTRQDGCPEVGIQLRVLIGGIRSIADTATKARHQQATKSDGLEIQIRTPRDKGPAVRGEVSRIMISGNIEKIHIKGRDHVLEIVIRQVSTTYYKIDVTKVTRRNKVI